MTRQEALARPDEALMHARIAWSKQQRGIGNVDRPTLRVRATDNGIGCVHWNNTGASKDAAGVRVEAPTMSMMVQSVADEREDDELATEIEELRVSEIDERSKWHYRRDERARRATERDYVHYLEFYGELLAAGEDAAAAAFAEGFKYRLQRRRSNVLGDKAGRKRMSTGKRMALMA